MTGPLMGAMRLAFGAASILGHGQLVTDTAAMAAICMERLMTTISLLFPVQGLPADPTRASSLVAIDIELLNWQSRHILASAGIGRDLNYEKADQPTGPHRAIEEPAIVNF